MISKIILEAMEKIEKKYQSSDDRWKALKAHLKACESASKSEKVLQNIYAGPPADIVNFSKSPEMAQWICDTVDSAGEALREGAG